MHVKPQTRDQRDYSATDTHTESHITASPVSTRRQLKCLALRLALPPSMKTLRRSLNSKDAPNGHPPISGPLSALPPVSRPNMKTQPPKKVIRALEAYRPIAPQELAFGKG